MHTCSWPSQAVKVSMPWKTCMRWDFLKFTFYHILFHYSFINYNYRFGNESSRFSLKFTYYHMLFNYSFINYNHCFSNKSSRWHIIIYYLIIRSLDCFLIQLKKRAVFSSFNSPWKIETFCLTANPC